MSLIEFVNIAKSYGDTVALSNINLSIEKGEFLTIIGPSGCGKTTLLKLINATIQKSDGELYINGKSIEEWDLIKLRRSIGYSIQQVGLFPHMNVMQNIVYVLTISGVPKEERERVAKNMADIVRIPHSMLSKRPRELSGGQAQRVGVARALAADPDVILMDEPFGSVDEITRRILQDEIKHIHKTIGKTILFVTHDIEEALKLGTRVVLMNDGIIEETGNKNDMIFNPKSQFAADFMGHKNFAAYLGTTRLSERVSPISENEVKEAVSCMDENKLLIEAVRNMLENGQSYVCVKKDGKPVGKFTFRK